MNSVARNFVVLLERLIGLLAIIVCLPCLLLLALFLRTNTDELVLLTDRFVGTRGSPVQSYRFRTTGRGTPNFRSLGRFLRGLRLDELPGFLAVALGQCALSDVLKREGRK
jgi:lipopolysaccharide/colanic/teichoic acid biosynthesis glycosyltransferase